MLVEFEGSDQDAAHAVAYQIAALKAKYLTRDDVPADLVAAEKPRSPKETAKSEGKPGRATEDHRGPRQRFSSRTSCCSSSRRSRTTKKTVKVLLDEAGVTVTQFTRFEVGQA